MNTTESITTGEAARMLGVSSETVRRWIKSGYLPAMFLPSGQARINKQSITELQNRGNQ